MYLWCVYSDLDARIVSHPEHGVRKCFGRNVKQREYTGACRKVFGVTSLATPEKIHNSENSEGGL